MHIFDITKSASAINTWRVLEGRIRTHPKPLSSTEYGLRHSPLTGQGNQNAQITRVDNADLFITDLQSPLPPPVPAKIENPWNYDQASQPSESGINLTEREPKSRESPILESAGSLLAAFETDLFRLVEQNVECDKEVQSATESTLHSPTQAQTAASEAKQDAQFISKAGEAIGQTVNSLLGSIGLLTSELRSRLSQAERGLADVQLETSIQEALMIMKSHMHNLTQTVHDATTSMHATVAQSPHADILAATQVQCFRRLAVELGEMGKTFISAFEGSFSANTNVPNPLPPQKSISETIAGTTSVQSQGNAHVPSQPGTGRNSTLALENALPGIEAQETSSSSHTLFIGNLKPDTTEDMIRKTLMNCGFLGSVNLPVNSITGKHAGFGYIHFPSRYAATGATHALTNEPIDGQTVNVEYSQDRLTEDTYDTPSSVSPSKRPNSDIIVVPVSKAPKKHIHRRSKKTRPNVTFDVSSDEPPSANIRRAKSLGALAASRRNYSANTQYESESLGEGASRERVSYGPFAPHLNGSETSVSGPSRSSTLQDSQGCSNDVELFLRTLVGETRPRSPTPEVSFDRRQSGQPLKQRTSAENINIPSFPTTRSQQATIQNQGLLPYVEHQPLIPPVQGELPGAWPGEQRESRRHYRRHQTTIGLPPLTTSPIIPPSRPLTFSSSSYAVPNPSVYHPHATPPTFRSSPTDPLLATPGSFPSERSTHANGRQTTDMGANNAHHHAQPPQDVEERINACVEFLTALGFANGDNRDAARLRIYAEAVNGNLCDAIDMIEEERGAHEQRSAHE